MVGSNPEKLQDALSTAEKVTEELKKLDWNAAKKMELIKGLDKAMNNIVDSLDSEGDRLGFAQFLESNISADDKVAILMKYEQKKAPNTNKDNNNYIKILSEATLWLKTPDQALFAYSQAHHVEKAHDTNLNQTTTTYYINGEQVAHHAWK